MSLRILLTGRSDRHTRPSNQDRLYPLEDKLPASLDLPQCLAVADGMGGTEQGEFAAQVAIQDLPHLMHPSRWSVLHAGPQQPPQPENKPSPEQSIEAYFRYVNQRIIQSAGGSGQSGTTLSLIYLDNEHFWLGHIGDSRVYLYRQNTLTRLTRDDHALDYFKEKGAITLEPEELDLSEADRQYLEEQKIHKHKLLFLPDTSPKQPLESAAIHAMLRDQVKHLHQIGKLSPIEELQDRLMRALGTDKAFEERPILQPALEQIQALPRPGDLFLLCTDGLWNHLTDQAIAERFRQLLRRSKTAHLDPALLTWCCDQLIEDAIQAGSDDNITVLLGQILPSRTAPHTLSSENYPKDLKKILGSAKSASVDEDTEDLFSQPTRLDPLLLDDPPDDLFVQATSFQAAPAQVADFAAPAITSQAAPTPPTPPASTENQASQPTTSTTEATLRDPQIPARQASATSAKASAQSTDSTKTAHTKEASAKASVVHTIDDIEALPSQSKLPPPPAAALRASFPLSSETQTAQASASSQTPPTEPPPQTAQASTSSQAPQTQAPQTQAPQTVQASSFQTASQDAFNDVFAKTIQDEPITPLRPEAILAASTAASTRSTTGTRFSPHASSPASNASTSPRPLAQQERFVWIGVSGTLFLLCLFAWMGARPTAQLPDSPKRTTPTKQRTTPTDHTTPTDPRTAPTDPRTAPAKTTPQAVPSPAPSKSIPSSTPPTGPWLWLPSQLPRPLDSAFLQTRLRILQQIHLLHQDLALQWGLPPETLRGLRQTLHQEAISTTTIHRFSLQAPTPTQKQAVDRALQSALITTLEALAPTYTQKLDMMRSAPDLPTGAPLLPFPASKRKSARKELIQRWLQRTQQVGWKLWQLELLAEQIIDFPYPSSAMLRKGPWMPSDLDAIRRTTARLQHVLRLLQKEDPKHALLPDLQNRLQIQQAWLNETAPDEKP